MHPGDCERESKLVNDAIQGDEVALAQVFGQYRDRLQRMVSLRMDARVRARFDASDVVQEAFVDVVNKLPAYRGKEIPFFLWLRMVTGDRLAKLHRTHLGAEKRDANREVTVEFVPVPEVSSVYLAAELAGQFTSVDRGLKHEDVRHKVEGALNSMSSDDREIIAMRHFEALSSSEIAVILDITESGVRKRYTRALRRLSAAINSASDISLP